jgi:phage gpG-like protein
MSLKIDTSAVSAMFKEAVEKLGEDEVGRIAAGLLREDIKGHFAAGGRPAKWKSPKWRSGQPLVDKGILRNSIFAVRGQGGWVVQTNDVRAGTLHFGAKKGYFGTKRVAVKSFSRKGHTVRAHSRQARLPWGDIPARPFMIVRDELIPEIEAALKRKMES